MRRSGFTLVELSIVLVIIGLLIGGILAAQTMIRITKINSFVRQVQYIDASFSNFREKYNFLPGDALGMGGDGNGIITEFGSTTMGTAFSGEVANVWPNLNVGGFDTLRQYSSVVPAGGFNSDPNIMNAPFAVIGQKASFLFYTNPCCFMGRAMYKISNIQNVTNAAPSVFPSNPPHEINAVESVDALAIDLKMDDGNMGGLQSSKVMVYNYSTGTTNTVCNTSTHTKCVLFIRVMGQNGGQ